MPPELADIRRWLEKVDHDRRLAIVALAAAPPITDGAAFHCQQAVEKLLKAYLVAHGIAFEKIHDLERLLEQCAAHDAAFETLRDQAEPLSAYAVRLRYPGPADPSVEQVQTALNVVEKVWSFVTERLPPEVIT